MLCRVARYFCKSGLPLTDSNRICSLFLHELLCHLGIIVRAAGARSPQLAGSLTARNDEPRRSLRLSASRSLLRLNSLSVQKISASEVAGFCNLNLR